MSWSITFAERDYEHLHSHLFPGDGDEHGAVLACGLSKTRRGSRLLVREVFTAEDGKDFVDGQRGYKQLTPLFVAERADYCRVNGLAYVTAHNHGGRYRVDFSRDDLRSHERSYPALVQMTGRPVTALVFAEGALAGDIFTDLGRHELASATVLGSNIRTLRPEPTSSLAADEEAYDHQALMFGFDGQAIIGGLKVAIMGLGGGGSLINQTLARLGVGHILAIDTDKVEESNLSRIPGATQRDALGILPGVTLPVFRRLMKRTARYKVTVAERVAREANPRVRYAAVRGDVMDPEVARELLDCDFVFLATDTMHSRHLFNQVVHQYLIPGAQIGAKVSVDKSGAVSDVRVVVRPVLPDAGCLWCGGAISPVQLNREALSSEERERQRYVEDPDVHEPSVITLNSLGASQAVNDFLFMFTGLHEPDTRLRGRFQWARRRTWEDIGNKPDPPMPTLRELLEERVRPRRRCEAANTRPLEHISNLNPCLARREVASARGGGKSESPLQAAPAPPLEEL